MTRDRDSTTIQAAAYRARMEQDYGRDPDRPTRAEAARDDERERRQPRATWTPSHEPAP